MDLSPLKTKKLIKQALENENLRKAVKKATDSSIQSLGKIVDQIPYWEHLKKKNHLIKRDVIQNLDTYLSQFEFNCKKNGIQVHWAINASEAREMILKLAK